MKQILISIVLAGAFTAAYSQHKPSLNRKFEKEIGLNFFVLYPDEYAPSVNLNTRKIVSPTFQIGAGITELYERYYAAFYVPVYANLQSYIGKAKRLSIHFDGGYGFFKNTVVSDYAWGPGKVIVNSKGGFYYSVGPGYNFKIGRGNFKGAINYVHPSSRKSIFVEHTSQLMNNREVDKVLSVSLACIF